MSLQTRLGALITAIGADIKALSRPLVTALPGSPVNGQECYFQSAAMAALTIPIMWHLRYNSTTSKWDVIGGGDLYDRKTGGTAFTSTTPIDIPGSGSASVTLPVVGLYIVRIECDIVSSAAPLYTFMGVSAAGAVVGDNCFSAAQTETAQGVTNRLALAAGAIKNQCWNGTGVHNGFVYWNSIYARPVTLG